MSWNLKQLRGHVLRGYAPSVVRTSHEAFALSERLFTRLGSFAFHGTDGTRLISSGPAAGGLCVRLVSSSGHRIAIREDDKLAILFPYRGVIEVTQGNRVERAVPSEILVVEPGSRETNLSQDYLGILVHVPATEAAQLDYRWREAGGNGRRTRLVTRLDDCAVISRVHALIEQIERPSGQAGRPWTAHLASLWNAVSLAIEAEARPAAESASLAQVRRAEAFMAAHWTEPLDMADVARAVGVGPRSLQLAFRRHRRSSPLRFLHDRRLEEARRRLSVPAPDATVTAVAHDCGFPHLGRFAQAYTRAFGEPPSRALRRATAPSAGPAADR